MLLTRENFQSSLPAVIQLLKSCSFVSFDLEFSGLFHARGARQTPLDTTAQRFRSAHASTGDFFPLQLGLSIFSQSAESWIAQPISIHLIPTEDERRSFAVLPSSISFLASNGFDFQKSFANGVGWLTVEREQQLLQELEKDRSGKDEIVVTEGLFCFGWVTGFCISSGAQERDLQFVESVRALLSAPASGSTLLETADFVHPPDFRDFLVMKPMNRFLRRLVFETVAREDPNVVVVGLGERFGERLALKRLGSADEVAR